MWPKHLSESHPAKLCMIESRVDQMWIINHIAGFYMGVLLLNALFPMKDLNGVLLF